MIELLKALNAQIIVSSLLIFLGMCGSIWLAFAVMQ